MSVIVHIRQYTSTLATAHCLNVENVAIFKRKIYKGERRIERCPRQTLVSHPSGVVPKGEETLLTTPFLFFRWLALSRF